MNTNKKFTKSLIEISSCPLCNSKLRKHHSIPQRNLYSEILSNSINVEEKKFLQKVKNVECLKCGLVYKKFWFKKFILSNLFNNSIPLHPKGRDTYLNRFKKKEFTNTVNQLNKNIKKKNINKFNKILRILNSILEGLSGNILLKKKFNLLLNEKELRIDELNKIANQISTKIKKPKRFSRFVGFNDEKLWKFFNSKIKNLKSYAEIGCPSWGLIKIAKKYGKKVFFLKRKEINFWGKKCYYSKNGCIKNLLINKDNIMDYESSIKNISLIGIIEYFDHIENPLLFTETILRKTNNFFYILDDIAKANITIQHFSGWSKKSLSKLAKLTDTKLFIDNKIIKDKKVFLAIFKKN